MKKSLLTLSVIFGLLTQTVTAQITVAGWNFNSQTILATSGSGTLSFVGGTGSPIYINNAGTQALGFADFPLDGTLSGTAGIKFAFSTVGNSGISISFDTYGHNQSSKWQQFEYTTDGTTWVVLSNNGGLLSSLFTTTTLNFPPICDNKANFAFRIVSIFNPAGGTVYEQVQGGGYNGNNGKWYFDNVTGNASTLNTANNTIVGFKMFPNPAQNSINFESNSNSLKEIEIYNILGKSILSKNQVKQTLDISSLNKGIYVIKIIEEGKINTEKLIIN